MAGTPTGTITLDSGNAADASYLGNFELYSTASTGSATWSPGSVTMPADGLLVAIYTGRDSNGTSGVTLNSISLGGSTATLYKLNVHANNIDKYYVATRQVSSGSNAVSVAYSGTLTGSGDGIDQVISLWYVSGQTSDIPRTVDANIVAAVTSNSITVPEWGKSVSIFQYWAHGGSSHSYTGNSITSDVALNKVGANPNGTWGAQHKQNTGADLGSITTGFSWTTGTTAVIVQAFFK